MHYVAHSLSLVVLAFAFLQANVSADETLPKTVNGRILDEQEMPVAGVQIGFTRTRFKLDTTKAEPERSTHTLGRTKSDIMGGFVIRFDNSVATKGPLYYFTWHRDYELVHEQRRLDDRTELTITLKLLRRVALIHQIRNTKDPVEAKQLTLKLLREDDLGDQIVEEVFPYVHEIRESLRRVAKSEPFDNVRAYRARMLLAHGADPRDEDILRQWWEERREDPKQTPKSVPDWIAKKVLLPDDIEGDSLRDAIDRWRKSVAMHESTSDVVSEETAHSALVWFVHSRFPWQHNSHGVFALRDGKWRLIFHRPTGYGRIDFDF